MPRLAWSYFALLVACGGGDSLDYEGTPGTPVNAAFSAEVPVVGGRIDGEQSIVLADTGAPVTILDTTVFGEPEGTREVDLEAFALTFPAFPVAVFDLFGPEPQTEEAIIGGDLLRHFAFTLDYRGGRVWLDDSFDRDATPNDVSVEAEQVVETRLLGGGVGLLPGGERVTLAPTRIIVTAFLEGSETPFNLLVDTGASALVLQDGLVGTLGTTASRPILQGVRVGTVDGEVAAFFTRVWRVRLGNVSSDDVPVLVLPGSTLLTGLSREVGFTVHGLVGGSVLRHYLTTIDYPEDRLRLARYTDQSHVDPDEFIKPGFALDVVGGVYQLVEVYPGTDADVDGLNVGDVIEEIAGMPITGMSRGVVADLIGAYSLGQDVPVGVRRGSVIETVSVRVQDLLPSFPPP